MGLDRDGEECRNVGAVVIGRANAREGGGKEGGGGG